MKRIPWLGAAVLLTFAGCTVLDRTSYSVVFAGKAHQYQETKKPAPPESTDRPAVTEAAFTESYGTARHDLDALIDPFLPGLEAFKPFAYCHLHGSSHPLESVFALALAPIEYPAALLCTIPSARIELGYPADYGPALPVVIEDLEHTPTK